MSFWLSLWGFICCAFGTLFLTVHSHDIFPIGFRFFIGLMTFGLTPGVLIWLLSRSDRSASGRSLGLNFLFIVSLAFSVNLIFNVILLVAPLSFLQLALIYLSSQLCAFVALMVHHRRQARWPALNIQAHPLALTFGVSFAAYLIFTFINGGVAIEPEELIVMRKLAENPIVKFNNISMVLNQPSTYFFTPFHVFKVGVSLVAGLDTTLVSLMFFTVTTSLSILCFVELVRVVSGSNQAAYSMGLFCVLVAVFDPFSMIMLLGQIVVHPNRLGLAQGVLLPLNLLIFLTLLRERRTHWLMNFTLLYLTFEMTFVHAKETLILIAMIFISAAILATQPLYRRQLLPRLAMFVGAAFAVLLTYKVFNLSLSPNLNTYVAELSRSCREALTTLIDQKGFFRAFFKVTSWTTDASNITALHVRNLITDMVSYKGLFVSSWQGSRVRFILPVVLLFLPFYVLQSRSLVRLILACALTLFPLVSLSPGIQLTFSSVIGNPEVLFYAHIVYTLAFVIFIDMVMQAGSVLAASSRRFLWAGVGGVAWILAVRGGYVDSWRGSLAGAWTTGFGAYLHLATLVAVVWKVTRSPNLELFPQPKPAIRGPWPIFLLVASLLPSIIASDIWGKNYLSKEYIAAQFNGEIVHDYQVLVQAKKAFPQPFPESVVRFIREELAPNRVVLSQDSFVVAMFAPHFSPFYTQKGKLDHSYIDNQIFAAKYPASKEYFTFNQYVGSDQQIGDLIQMASAEAVDTLIVGPEESGPFRRAWQDHTRLKEIFEPVFAQDGYAIYRLRAAL